MMESAKRDLGDLGAAVERLRPEFEAYEKGHYRLGFTMGVDWVRNTASYYDLKRLDLEETHSFNSDTFKGDTFHKSNSWFVKIVGDARTEASKGVTKPFNVQAFYKGWFDGANVAWDFIKARLNAG